MTGRRGVPLGALARTVSGRPVGDSSVRITDVTHDSRQARPGCLFVAVRGFRADGHRFAPAALRAGAAALCVEEELPLELPQLVVADTRRALGPLAAEVHGHPSREMAVVGVTGTNGKTTVTFMLEAVAAAADRRTGLIGTVGARVAGEPVSIPRTTPEAGDLQRLLARMREAGVEVVAMEVSSHALALGRVEATWFEVGAFTNLSQDHLDFHADLEEYFSAKASLFRPDRVGRAVVCVDDRAGRRLAASLEIPGVRVAVGGEAELVAEEVRTGVSGSSFRVRTPEGSHPVRLPVGGEFNVANALVALGCALQLGIPAGTACRALAGMERVPGRFETVDGGQDFAVIVDYAHTPEGVGVVIGSARRATPGRVIAVLGAGGDRDRAKRPLMGGAAGAADLVVVTSDNPRSEDPAAIVAEVARGARQAGAAVVEEVDRRRAIRAALRAARAGDVVLILGKGHETGQEFADRVEPFDDRRVALEELARS